MRVEIRTPKLSDAATYAAAFRRSVEHIGRWNPVEPDGLVGSCNVANIVRGRFQNGTLGYNSFLPYNGTGRMTEGMRLVVDRCFAPESAGGLGLHRVEINVQPENGPSVAMARRLGFRLEGVTTRMLFLQEAWRDHERYALTVEEWPTPLSGSDPAARHGSLTPGSGTGADAGV